MYVLCSNEKKVQYVKVSLHDKEEVGNHIIVVVGDNRAKYPLRIVASKDHKPMVPPSSTSSNNNIGRDGDR